MNHKSPYNTRNKNTAPLKEVFEELLRAYQLKDTFDEKQVISSWGEIMGNTVSKRTTGLSVKDKILYVKLSSGPVKKELMMNKSKVLQLIADKFGNKVLNDIVFL